MRKRKSEPMPLKFAAFMLAVGILMGSVFTFGMNYWNARVTRESCKVINTQFLSHDEIWNHRTVRIKEIAIDCANGNRYFIDGVSIDTEFRNELSLLSENENITLLIHPNSNTIVEFTGKHGTLLRFDETIDKLDDESSGFLFLGIFMYFCAVVGLYYVVLHIIHRKEKR